jgi:hypothetical protein
MPVEHFNDLITPRLQLKVVAVAQAAANAIANH